MATETRVFARSIESVREARRFIRLGVEGAGGDPDAAELLTAELAANAVFHADSDYEVRLIAGEHSVRVEVVNDRPEMIAALVKATTEGGRGLTIVDRMASAWGVETTPEHKTIWFELPRNGA